MNTSKIDEIIKENLMLMQQIREKREKFWKQVEDGQKKK